MLIPVRSNSSVYLSRANVSLDYSTFQKITYENKDVQYLDSNEKVLVKIPSKNQNENVFDVQNLALGFALCKVITLRHPNGTYLAQSSVNKDMALLECGDVIPRSCLWYVHEMSQQNETNEMNENGGDCITFGGDYNGYVTIKTITSGETNVSSSTIKKWSYTKTVLYLVDIVFYFLFDFIILSVEN